MGKLKQGSNSYTGATIRAKEETVKAEGKPADLWQPKWNENQIVLATVIHTLNRNTGPPGRHSGWELELRDCGAIPELGLLLTADR